MSLLAQTAPIQNGSSNYNGDLYHKGDIGLTTTAPSARLHIVKPSASLPVNIWSEDYIKIEKEIINPGIPITFSYDTKFIVKENGNVGIGTANPSDPLHVEGSGLFKGNITLGNNNWSSLTIDANGDNDWMFNAHNDGEKFHVRGLLNGSWKYRMTFMRTTGYIGINNTNPQDYLHIKGTLNDPPILNLENTDPTYGSQVKLSAIGGYNLRREGQLQYEESFSFFDQAVSKRQVQILPSGKVQIGDETITSGTHNTADVKLSVDGHAIFRKVIVTQSDWADFVFAEDYKLKSLPEVEEFITANKHLPDVPSESEVIENGISLGDMDAILLQKIEELTLYMIDLQKKNEILEQEIAKLKTK